MEYYLTKHAQARMAERGISNKLLNEALHNPTEIMYDNNGRMLYKYVYIKENAKRLLIIVLIPEKNRVKIITVIDTSKIRKYI